MMALIRINRNDLEDLRMLLLYSKENEMDVEDINKIILFLGNKYGFDPFTYAINILTGIVSERKRMYPIFDEASASYNLISDKVNEEKKPLFKTAMDAHVDNEAVNIQVTRERNGVKKILINGSKSTVKKEKDPKEYLPELDKWIKTNDMDYIKLRKLISNIEYSKRVKEITPNLVSDDSEYLCEFQEWVESRNLDYLKIRMMLAILAQEEENKKREKVIAYK